MPQKPLRPKPFFSTSEGDATKRPRFPLADAPPEQQLPALYDRIVALENQLEDLAFENQEQSELIKQQRYIRLNLYRSLLALAERLAGYEPEQQRTLERYAELLHDEKINLILAYGSDNYE